MADLPLELIAQVVAELPLKSQIAAALSCAQWCRACKRPVRNGTYEFHWFVRAYAMGITRAAIWLRAVMIDGNGAVVVSVDGVSVWSGTAAEHLDVNIPKGSEVRVEVTATAPPRPPPSTTLVIATGTVADIVAAMEPPWQLK